MKGRFGLLAAVCALVVLFGCTSAYAAQVWRGTLVDAPADAGYIRLSVDGDNYLVSPAKNAKIMRGQLGKNLRDVAITEFAPGDWVVAMVNQDGTASSLKAFFDVEMGEFLETDAGKLILADDRIITMNASVQIILPDGKTGAPEDLKKGSTLVCRVHPKSREAWTVLASNPPKPVESPESPKQENPVPAAATTDQPSEKVEIVSINYSSPDVLKAGDIIKVELKGTPGGKATCEVKNLFEPTPMKEAAAGVYKAELVVPGNTFVKNSPLLGRLTVGGFAAAPVQAGKLVTVPFADVQQPAVVEADKAESVAVSPAQVAPVEDPKPDVKPANSSGTESIDQQSKAVIMDPAPVDTPVIKDIILTTPADGAKIKSALLVRGIAEPDAKVMVEITYSNGMSGILKLAGQVMSQLVAVGNNGEFRLGPIPLEGPLATKGLNFRIKVYYPEHQDHSTVTVNVIGDRS